MSKRCSKCKENIHGFCKKGGIDPQNFKLLHKTEEVFGTEKCKYFNKEEEMKDNEKMWHNKTVDECVNITMVEEVINFLTGRAVRCIGKVSLATIVVVAMFYFIFDLRNQVYKSNENSEKISSEQIKKLEMEIIKLKKDKE